MIICNTNEFLNVINLNKKVLMALDIGRKKTGVAFSDPDMKFSLASKVIKSESNKLPSLVVNLIKTFDIGGLIIGLPINNDGSLNKKCYSIKDITKNLDFKLIDNNMYLPIFFWDESFSSQAAMDNIDIIFKKTKNKKKIIDKFAAKVFLQDFLDYKNNKNEQK